MYAIRSYYEETELLALGIAQSGDHLCQVVFQEFLLGRLQERHRLHVVQRVAAGNAQVQGLAGAADWRSLQTQRSCPVLLFGKRRGVRNNFV